MTEISMAKARHFRMRLEQRHGIILHDRTFAKFCDNYRERNAALQLSCRLGVHKVEFGGIIIAVLWDRKHGVPVTALMEGARLRGTKGIYKWHGGAIHKVKEWGKG